MKRNKELFPESDRAIANNEYRRSVRLWLAQMPELNEDEGALLNLIQDCYKDFLVSGDSIKDLAARRSLPITVLVAWVRAGKWMDRRREFRDDLAQLVEMDYLEVLRSSRKEVVKTMITKLNPIVEVLSQRMAEAGEAGDSHEARRLSEAIKNIGEIVLRAAAITGNPPETAAAPKPGAADADGSTRKQPFFRIDSRGPVSITTTGPDAGEEPHDA